MVHLMFSLVTAERLSLSGPTATLVDSISLTVDARSRIAIVGRNGSGKSTLLEAVHARACGLELPTYVEMSGLLRVAPGVRTGLLPQAPPIWQRDLHLADYLDRSSSGATHAFEGFTRATERLAVNASDANVEAYSQAVDAMNANDAWNFAQQRDAVLKMLVGDIDLRRPLATLSGGETTKVALAGILLGAPQLLLLDEPTNNLDVAALNFLATWLRNSSAAMLVVSHDRAFLDATVTEVAAIDEYTHALHRYTGTYSDYAAARRVEFDAATRLYEEQQHAHARLSADVRRIGAMALTFERSQNDYRRARGKKVARRAVVQRARVERTLTGLAEPLRPRRPHIDVPEDPPRHEGVVVRADNVSWGIDGAVLVRDVSLRVEHGERILITGPNGAGKTSLLRLLCGEVTPTAGSVTTPPGLRIAALAQMPPEPRRGDTALAYARRLVAISEDDAGALLGKVLFEDVAHRPVGEFSVGERRRIELAVLFAGRPDVVLLDEPTNHLDLETIEMLEAALAVWRGAVIAVTHDRRFIESIGAHRVIEMSHGALAAVSQR